jgi:hypothetical protein
MAPDRDHDDDSWVGRIDSLLEDVQRSIDEVAAQIREALRSTQAAVRTRRTLRVITAADETQRPPDDSHNDRAQTLRPFSRVRNSTPTFRPFHSLFTRRSFLVRPRY